MGFWVELTTLVIPGMNDSEEELKKIAKFIVGLSPDVPWHVTAFYPCYKMMDREPTSDATLMRAWEIGKAAGLRYVYTGNILGGHHNTECFKCGEVLVKRSGMGCEECKIEATVGGDKSGSAGKSVAIGKCPKCGEKIAGVWR
jgi:pyruvate formate lyase activating enzyme